MSGKPNSVAQKIAWIPASSTIDVYMVNAMESIMCGPEVAKEFLNGIRSAESLAEKAWELACAGLAVRNRHCPPEDHQS